MLGKIKANICKKRNIIAAAICGIVLLGCMIRIFQVHSVYSLGDARYSGIEQSMQPSGSPRKSTGGSAAAAKPFVFDFQKLKAQNADAAGWIRLPGTSLSYPVVQGGDNTYYLDHTFQKQKSIFGCVFLDGRGKPRLTGQNLILYGHNMKNGSMFADLCRFRDRSYLRGHPEFLLYTKKGMYHCPVFSVHEAAPDSDTYALCFSGRARFSSYLEEMEGQSLYKTGVKTSPNGRILTLSTCVENGQDRRFVVQAVIA
ncbi:MAG TPA: class B sortase [Caproicibacter sp.]|nr:class B sortase [Caproicibacter sp.]